VTLIATNIVTITIRLHLGPFTPFTPIYLTNILMPSSLPESDLQPDPIETVSDIFPTAAGCGSSKQCNYELLVPTFLQQEREIFIVST